MSNPEQLCSEEHNSTGRDKTQDERRDGAARAEPPSWTDGESLSDYRSRVSFWANDEVTKLNALGLDCNSTVFAMRSDEISRRANEAILKFEKEKDRENEELRELIQGLRESNKEKDRKLEEKDRENEKLRESDKKNKMELEEKNRELKTQNDTGSVRKILEIHDGDYPDMNRNDAVYPSLGNTPSGTGKRAADVRNEEPNKIQKLDDRHAKIDKLEPFNISQNFEKFEINFETELDNGVIGDVKSSLYTGLFFKCWNQVGRKLMNINESTVCDNVILILNDVIKCLGLSLDEVCVAREFSFFSIRPDIVVLYYMNAIALCIEVKNPGTNPYLVMRSGYAAGQCLDYTFGLKNAGIDIPIVCLSTYETMRIGSCEKSIRTILEKTLLRLKEVKACQPFSTINKPAKKQCPSPEKLGNAVKIPCDEQKSDETNYDEQKSDETKEVGNEISDGDRTIYFSEVITRGNCHRFKAYYLAIAMACVSVELSTEVNGGDLWKCNKIPQEGEVIKNRWYNEVREESYRWKKINGITATFALKTSWNKDPRIYMTEILGMGRTGKVYLCMDYKGRHFAVKMLLFNKDGTKEFTKEGRVDTQKILNDFRRKIESEAQRWRTVYPEYKKSIWTGKLNGMPCFAMPYVASTKISERKGLLPEIEKELKRVAELGFIYKGGDDGDVRWRHIGLRQDKTGENKIILIDLESLEDVKDLTVTERDNRIAKIMKELGERAEKKK